RIVGQKRLSTDGGVNFARGISTDVGILERQIAYGSVSRTVNIFEKRVIANSVVLVSVTVVKQRKGTETVVEVGAIDAESVIDERIGSIGAVLRAGAVEQKRRSAGGSIGIRTVEDQRSAAKRGIVAGGGSFKERIPTNCCVSSAGS